MSAVKSIEPIEARLKEIVDEMAAEFAQRNPSHHLSQEATVLWDTKAKLQAINGATPAKQVFDGGGLERRIPGKGKQPKGRVAQHEAARLAVVEMKRPLQTGEIVGHMPRFGADISGPNAERNLTSILSKRGDLVSVRWRGKRAWWPKGEEVPE